jgi:hypothetical protein
MTWNPQTVTLGVLTCQEFESVVVSQFSETLPRTHCRTRLA